VARPSWTGVGPDNFRRLYGRYAGRTFWDERVSANNLALETGATTGLLGVLALAGTLGARASAVRRCAA
jgi:O-antigen ligase